MNHPAKAWPSIRSLEGVELTRFAMPQLIIHSRVTNIEEMILLFDLGH